MGNIVYRCKDPGSLAWSNLIHIFRIIGCFNHQLRTQVFHGTLRRTYHRQPPPHDPSGARDPSPIGELTLELLGGKTRLSGAVMARKGCLPFKPKWAMNKKGYPGCLGYFGGDDKLPSFIGLHRITIKRSKNPSIHPSSIWWKVSEAALFVSGEALEEKNRISPGSTNPHPGPRRMRGVCSSALLYVLGSKRLW